MDPTLGIDDCKAVDLLLDRVSQLTPEDRNRTRATPYVVLDSVTPKRVTSAQRLLQVLDLLPAADPPEDLLSRTLQLVDQSAAPRGDAGRHGVPDMLSTRQQSHA